MFKKELILHKEDLLKSYNEGATISQLMHKYDSERHRMIDVLRLAGAIIRPDHLTHSKRYTIDDTFFEKVDTEEKAYILGFLYADGYNDTKHNCIRLTLAETDKIILEKINKILGHNKPLRFYERVSKNPNWQNAWALDIENKKMCLDLEKLGCMKAKTHILEFPTEEQVPSYLHNHFIRGYFDGDGCISSNANVVINNRKPTYTISFVGNLPFLLKVQEILMLKLNFSKTKLSKRYKDRVDTIFSLYYGGNRQLPLFSEYLYKDSTIFLERKKNKFESMCQY